MHDLLKLNWDTGDGNNRRHLTEREDDGRLDGINLRTWKGGRREERQEEKENDSLIGMVKRWRERKTDSRQTTQITETFKSLRKKKEEKKKPRHIKT